MKKIKGPLTILIAVQFLLGLLATYFISKISLIGKIGIAIFYKEYKLLRSGWKTFFLLFALQLIVIGILYFISKKGSHKRTVFAAGVVAVIALTGLISTFIDFQYTYSHRLLKERFHLGFYLFWLSMMGTCGYFIFRRDTFIPSSPGLSDTI